MPRCKLVRATSATDGSRRAALQAAKRSERAARVAAYALPKHEDETQRQRLKAIGLLPVFASDPDAGALSPQRRAMIGAGPAGKWGFMSQPAAVTS